MLLNNIELPYEQCYVDIEWWPGHTSKSFKIIGKFSYVYILCFFRYALFVFIHLTLYICMKERELVIGNQMLAWMEVTHIYHEFPVD